MITRAPVLVLGTVVALAADLRSVAVQDMPALRVPAARSLALPVPGRLLVEAPPFGLAIVEHDGRIAQLGNWYDAAWSPDGARVAAIYGRTLAVLDETGTVRWIDRRPANAPPTQPDWRLTGGALPTAAAGRRASSLMMAGAIAPWQTGFSSPVPGGARACRDSSPGRVVMAPSTFSMSRLHGPAGRRLRDRPCVRTVCTGRPTGPR